MPDVPGSSCAARLLLAALLSAGAMLGCARAADAASPSRAARGATATSWTAAKLGLPAAWRLSHGRGRAVVAVVDSGVAPGVRGLRGALVAGHDFVGQGSDTSDDFGHGTVVAGAVAGRPSADGAGGACPTCLVMPIRVIDASGLAQPAAVAAGVRWAVDHGAQVVNLSLVMNGADPAVTDAVQYALSHRVAVVAGAGNTGVATPFWPAALPGVLGVGATDARDRRMSWSNYGGWVAVAAPGCVLTHDPHGSLVRFCGTSAAAALVSGVVALGLAVARTSGADVAAVLLRTAASAEGFGGAGRVDAARLVRTLEASPGTAAAG
jgi:hypothetical protein